jgi:site-specific recombinase XerD
MKFEHQQPDDRSMEPFSRDEVERLLRDETHNPLRDRVIVLLLLDTGIRAYELCDLRMGDIHGTQLRVFGNDEAERNLPLSPLTHRVLAEYLRTRLKQGWNELVFEGNGGRPMDLNTLRRMLRGKGERTNVDPCDDRRFRHTFAINFLRRSGDIYTLQELLDQPDLERITCYLGMVRSDPASAHAAASPVASWGLKLEGAYRR